MSEQNKTKTLLERLKYKYRLIVINEDTFEQKASVRLSRINIYSILSVLIVGVAVIIFSLIAFTPLKFVMPGVGSYNERGKLYELSLVTDSMQQVMNKKDKYVANVLNILNGDLDSSYSQTGSKPLDTTSAVELDNLPAEDQALREYMENELEYSVNGNSELEYENFASLSFINPIEGVITDKYAISNEHYGVDIAGEAGEPVKAVLDGAVIDAGWNYETGHYITLQHENNLITVYKHNAEVLKKTGSFVKQGDVIAVVGNSGKLSTGPHLHFEIWHLGKALNPEHYLFLKTIIN